VFVQKQFLRHQKNSLSYSAGHKWFSVVLCSFQDFIENKKANGSPLKCLQRLNEGWRLYFAIGVKDFQRTSESLAVPIAWDEGDYVWIWASRSV